MVSFCTPVCYSDDADRTTFQSALEFVDDYFYLGGKKAQVVVGLLQDGKQGAILVDKKASWVELAIKVLSYATLAIPLLMLIAKSVLRHREKFYFIDVQKCLEKGIEISDATRAKIQTLLPKILKREEEGEVRLHRGSHIVFTLDSVPGLIFKLADPQKHAADAEVRMQNRFANIVKGKEVCLFNQLNALVIPQAKLIEVEAAGKKYTLIAEERLKVNTDPAVQEELYSKTSESATKAIEQLAKFIAKTGFNDIDWHKIPIVEPDSSAPAAKERRIALLDLEHMNGAREGLFGTAGKRGLMGCLPTDQRHVPGMIAREHDIKYSEEEGLKSIERMDEHQEYVRLQKFYEKKGILQNPTQALKLGEITKYFRDEIGIDLHQQAKYKMPTFTDGDGWDKNHSLKWGEVRVGFWKVLEDVVDAINADFAKNHDKATPKTKRYVFLDVTKAPLSDYRKMPFFTDDEIPDTKQKELWLRRIIDMLASCGFIFKLDKSDERGYYLQA